MTDFFQSLNFHQGLPSTLDEFLNKGPQANSSVYSLTDKARMAKSARGLALPAFPGSRVAFNLDLESAMFYTNPPANGEKGSVVLVRTASGDLTSIDNFVFVKWDSGKFGSFHHSHLKPSTKISKKNVKMASDIQFQPSQWLRVAGTDDLINKASRDLWSCAQTNSGDIVISRLFDDKGEPLKV